MDNKTTSKLQKDVATGVNITLSSVIVTILVAFLAGTMMGSSARQLFVTMFSPDVVVLPNTDK
ncbi:MAG TPA: hypothetical protein V6D14_11680 [Coleofasciculaceae cyanobacterium]|jgi:hypothetical protein